MMSDASASQAIEEPTPAGGDEHLTLVERVVGLLPLPFPWAALLIAAILGAPGSLLVAYLETGNIGHGLTAFFHGYMPEKLWQQVLAVILWYAFYVTLLWTIRHARLSLRRAEPRLAPLLPETAVLTRISASLARLLPALLLGLALEGAFIGDYRMRIAEAPGPISAAYEAISGPPLYLMAGTAIWVYARAVWGVYQLGRGPLRLKPFYEDKTMGLRPVASLSLSLSMGYFSLLFIMVLMLFIGPVQLVYVYTVIGLIILGVVLFFAPLISTHARMTKEKRALQAGVRERWKTILAANLVAPGFPPAISDVSAIVTLEALERKIATVRTWPFDLPILGKLGVMALTIVLGLLTQLLKNLLGL